MPTLIGNAPGFVVNNTSVDYDSMTDEEKLEFLRDKMGRDMPNIHKLSDTEKADYQRLKELEKAGWAKAKESEAGIQSKIEGSKRAADIMSAGNNGSIPAENNTDLSSQTPASKASAESILPGAETKSEPVSTADNTSTSNADNTDNSNSSSSNDKTKQQAKQESRYKLRSIMDAYNEELIDPETRDYLIMDVIAKFVRNMGKDIGNIAAAYTGGTINNEREESIWSKRNEEMAKKAINAEGNKLRNEDNYDLDYQSQKLDLAKKRIQMVPAQNFQKAANEMRKAGNEPAAAIMDLIAAASTQGVDPEEYIAAVYANDPNIKELVDNSIGSLSNVAGILGDSIGDIEEILKAVKDKLR